MTEPPLLRNSERSTFRRCAQKWWWSYREGLVPKYEDFDALWFGTGVHEALAQWYKPGLRRGRPMPRVWDKWSDGEERSIRTAALSGNFQEDTFVNAQHLGHVMLQGYAEKYGKDETWFVVDTEHPFRVEIPDPDKPHKILCILAGTFDGVFIDLVTNTVWLMEHKTAKNVSVAHLPLDDQAGTYWMVASTVLRDEGVLEKGQRIKGIQYNYLRKAIPDERPKDDHGRYLNKDGSISKVQPKPLFVRPEPTERGAREQNTQLARLQREVKLMNRIRAGKQEIIKNTAYDCMYCPFFEMCLLHEKGGDQWKEYRDAMYEVRDPYPASYRKSAAE